MSAMRSLSSSEVTLCPPHSATRTSPDRRSSTRGRLSFLLSHVMSLQLEFPPGGAVPPGFGAARWFDLDAADMLDETFDHWGDSPFAVLRGAGAIRDKFEALLACYLFAHDGSRAIELHVLEGLFAPFVFVSDEIYMSDPQPEFGHAAIDPAFLFGVFERLTTLGLDTSAASDAAVRARLAKARQDFASDFADDDRFRVKLIHFVPLEGVYDGGGSPFLYGRPAGDALAPGARWLAELHIITLADDAESLSPFGDLALLAGGRASLTAKRGANGRFRTVGDRLAQAAATANSVAVGPVETRGADVAFFLAARPWPIPLLGGVPTAMRAVRDPDDRRRFFDGELAARGAVVRERFPTVLTHCPTLAAVLTAAPAYEQYDGACCLMRAFAPSLEAHTLGAYVMLDAQLAGPWRGVTDRGATASERIAQLLAVRESAVAVRSAPPPAPAAPAAPGAAHSGDFVSCFSPIYDRQLAAFLTSDVVVSPLVLAGPAPAQGNPDDRPADLKESGLLTGLTYGPQGGADPVAALQACFERREIVLTQFCSSAATTAPAKPRVSHPLWDILARHRLSLASYVSHMLATDDTGTADEFLNGWTINKVTLAKAVTGRWAEIDFEVELQQPMEQWAERAQLGVVPDPVTKCVDPRRQWRGARRRQLVHIGERLIGALGFLRRQDDGPLAFTEHVISFLDDGTEDAENQDVNYATEMLHEMWKSAGQHYVAWLQAGGTFPPLSLPSDRCFDLLAEAKAARLERRRLFRAYPNMRHAMRPSPIPPPPPPPRAPPAAPTSLLPAAPPAPPLPPSPRALKRQRRDARRAAATAESLGAPAPAPSPNTQFAPSPPGPPSPNPRQPSPQPRRQPLAPGELADQGTVADGICTLIFTPANGTGARTTSWRVDECAASLGIDPSAVCWPKVIVSAQARVPSAQADHAMARCKHIGQPGHEHDGSAAHVVPAGLTSSVLASFRNP